MPRTTLPIAILLLVIGTSTAADARAAYLRLPEAVRTAEIVAVVEVEGVQPAELVGGHSTYRQRVIAHPVEVLKGELPPTFAIAGERDFICAPVHYDAPATYIVFLAHDGTVLATVNHELGRTRIDEDRLDWPYDDSNELLAKPVVLAKLRALIGRQGPTPAGPPVVELVPAAEPAEAIQPLPPPPPTAPPVVDAAPDVAVAIADAPREPAVEATDEPWLVPVSIGAGAFAVMLGFVVAHRTRRRR